MDANQAAASPAPGAVDNQPVTVSGTMERMRRVHVVVTGSVQGVGFRWSTQNTADRYGLAGWVRNRHDGAVEAQIEGSPDAVADMLDWLHQGPRSARVVDVEVVEIPAQGGTGFVVEP